ncbi:hypothetical protein N7537_000140 [Penicillium hordei]|uniref:Uncharacterized protein n=1 Tax=Penicillium hordei TaxID=40994 RepID=A0AAD6ED98_9EURO|nr:uncharacterized protein N7537_000140 [Penicillium hordei]KAJ5615026.1 hypothetical protein N7537_000140 [Penicillium hordei]
MACSMPSSSSSSPLLMFPDELAAWISEIGAEGSRPGSFLFVLCSLGLPLSLYPGLLDFEVLLLLLFMIVYCPRRTVAVVPSLADILQPPSSPNISVSNSSNAGHSIANLSQFFDFLLDSLHAVFVHSFSPVSDTSLSGSAAAPFRIPDLGYIHDGHAIVAHPAPSFDTQLVHHSCSAAAPGASTSVSEYAGDALFSRIVLRCPRRFTVFGTHS